MKPSLLLVAAPLLLFGPPRLGVQTERLPAGAVALIDAHYHVPESEARVYATAYRSVGNRREERDVALVRISAERYRLDRSWGDWPAAIVVGVEQGDHGKHGVAEALLLVDGAGKALRAGIAMTKPIFGSPQPRRVNDREIEEGYKQVATR